MSKLFPFLFHLKFCKNEADNLFTESLMILLLLFNSFFVFQTTAATKAAYRKRYCNRSLSSKYHQFVLRKLKYQTNDDIVEHLYIVCFSGARSSPLHSQHPVSVPACLHHSPGSQPLFREYSLQVGAANIYQTGKRRQKRLNYWYTPSPSCLSSSSPLHLPARINISFLSAIIPVTQIFV